MRGKYKIFISNRKVRYSFCVERKISIVTGYSGTGKSLFYRLVKSYNDFGKGSGIKVVCNRELIALDKSNYEKLISNEKGKIFVLDEYLEFTKSEHFARLVESSDSYFIIITRSYESIGNSGVKSEYRGVSYSVFSIYWLFKREVSIRKGYVENSWYNIYNNDREVISPDLLITEDSCVGKEFFDESLIIPVKSSCGVSKIIRTTLEEVKRLRLVKLDAKVAVLVDGEGFGPFVKSLKYALMSKDYLDNVAVLSPRSFEYLVLKSIFSESVSDELERTYDFCDSMVYNSWEEYYERLLSRVTQETWVIKYNKSSGRVLKYFLDKKNRNLILGELRDISKEVWKD